MSNIIFILYTVDPASLTLKKLIIFCTNPFLQKLQQKMYERSIKMKILQVRRKYSVYFKVKVSVILKMALKLKTSDATCSPSSPESHLSKTSDAKKYLDKK